MPILGTGTALIFRARPPVLSHPLYHQRPPTSRNLSFNGSRCSKGVHPRVSTSLHPSRVFFFYHELSSRGRKSSESLRITCLFNVEDFIYLFTYSFVYSTAQICFAIILLFRFLNDDRFKNRSRRSYCIVSHVEDDRFTPSAR